MDSVGDGFLSSRSGCISPTCEGIRALVPFASFPLLICLLTAFATREEGGVIQERVLPLLWLGS